jgi:uncharacterized protein YjiS (DUF1127 family)
MRQQESDMTAKLTPTSNKRSTEMYLLRSHDQIFGLSARRPRRTRFIASVFAALRRWKVALAAELAARRDVAELSAMSDYELRDIGISRSEIEGAVRRPRAHARLNDRSPSSNAIIEILPPLRNVKTPQIIIAVPMEPNTTDARPAGWSQDDQLRDRAWLVR